MAAVGPADEYLKSEAGRTECLGVITAAMELFSEDSAIQISGAVFIRATAKSTAIADAVRCMNGAKLIITAMKVHSDNSKVIQCSILALSVLCTSGTFVALIY